MAGQEFLDGFLEHAGEGSRDTLRNKFVPLKLEKGQYIFFDGDDATDLYLIESGVIEANIVHADGKLYIFHFVFPGEILGEGVLFGEGFCPFSAVVRKDATLWRIAKGDILPVLESDSSVSSYLFQLVGQKLYRCYVKARCIAGERVEKRLACVLLKAINEQGIAGCRARIDPPLTNRDISGLIGSTEETVSRIMSRLKREGVIGTEDKHIVVLDKEALARYTQSD
ncbi:MAG: Crp/Fnr family transcriptional regulator [Actinobacteria bacterium]|nr:Crp/Fnr family transcriptional regulator [Actinomycetota bacterium]MCG2820192.1 Crp/Fnr family transcriptional regulator [Actinomycetes bacterium]MBU4219836.1 Crp/Fnr family transcriptional regulator [Actinomycetota bacterium]MBU4357730.1 Crp/Fnr family transcriptional regulator [Actinomycetota bacterium]MBU4393268.1 Crp/Fnr family transcriptional regulator [Actinomycetota bacterium]